MQNYIDLIINCLNNGEWKDNRTGVRCLTTTSQLFSHDMREGFPLLTTKFTPLRLIAAELEMFISGITDKEFLRSKNVNIWNSWCNPDKIPQTSDEETKRHWQEKESDLGPLGYSWSWRRFGQEYKGIVTKKLPPLDKPFDQLNTVIRRLKSDPNCRRHVVSSWDVSNLSKMALAPCHMQFVFQHINGKLSLNWTHLIDFHIYENHISQCKELITRESHPLPSLKINNWNGFWDWTHKDVSCENYQHSGKLTAEVSV
jgi:thymidylate synthase